MARSAADRPTPALPRQLLPRLVYGCGRVELDHELLFLLNINYYAHDKTMLLTSSQVGILLSSSIGGFFRASLVDQRLNPTYSGYLHDSSLLRRLFPPAANITLYTSSYKTADSSTEASPYPKRNTARSPLSRSPGSQQQRCPR